MVETSSTFIETKSMLVSGSALLRRLELPHDPINGVGGVILDNADALGRLENDDQQDVLIDVAEAAGCRCSPCW